MTPSLTAEHKTDGAAKEAAGGGEEGTEDSGGEGEAGWYHQIQEGHHGRTTTQETGLLLNYQFYNQAI